MNDLAYVLVFFFGAGATGVVWAVMDGCRRWHEMNTPPLPTTNADRQFLDEAGIDWS